MAYSLGILRKIVGRLSLVVASTAFILLLLEVFIRLFLPQQLVQLRPDIWIPADTFGWRHAPNADTTINTGEREVRFTTDAQGHRVSGKNTDEGGYRILALGDSFLAGLQVEYQWTIPALLEKALSGQMKRKVVVVNTGVNRWGPSHYLLEARRELARARHDLVLVFLFVGNDIVMDRHESFPPKRPIFTHSFRAPRNLSSEELIRAIAYPVNDFLERHSHLFVLVKNRTWHLLMRMGLSARRFYGVLLRSRAGSKRWEVTTSLCRDIRGLAAAHGIQTLFVLLPANIQVDKDLAYRYAGALGLSPDSIDLDQPSRLLKEKFSVWGLKLLDTTHMLREARTGGLRDIFGETDPHLGPVGHELVVRYIRPTVVDLLSHRQGRR